MTEARLDLKVGDTIRHIKRGSSYLIIARALFSRELCDEDRAMVWTVEHGLPVVTRPDAVFGDVNLMLPVIFQCSITPPRIGIKGCTKAFIYQALLGGMIFARPEYEFTDDRFEGPL